MKRRTKNSIAVLAGTVFMMAASVVVHAEQNGWVRENSQWHYYQNDKMKVLSWIYDAENEWWFYVDEEGAMETGWGTGYAEGCYFNEDGIMMTGWQQLYAPEEDYVSPTTPSYWYYFDDSGRKATGWLKLDGDWYYFSEGQEDETSSGQMLTGLVNVQGNTYYFNEDNGRLVQDQILTFDGDKYYFSATGIMKKDSWVKLDNYLYYFDEDGRALKGKSSLDLYVTTIANEVYAFNASGRVVTSRVIYYVDGCWTIAKPTKQGEYATYTMNVYGKGVVGTYTVQ